MMTSTNIADRWTNLSPKSEKGTTMFSRQPQTRFHREATQSTAKWPTPKWIGRRYIRTDQFNRATRRTGWALRDRFS